MKMPVDLYLINLLKKENIADFKNFPLDSLYGILSHLTKKYGVFDFELKSEKSCYLGKLKSIKGKELTIYYLNPKGLWTKQMYFRINDIRTIEFDTDYINSLKLVSENKK